MKALNATIRVRFFPGGAPAYLQPVDATDPQAHQGSRTDDGTSISRYRSRHLQTAMPFRGAGKRDQLTFASYATAWLERLPLSKSTRAGYNAAAHDIWIPAFGDHHPAHMAPAEIPKIICDRLDKVSARKIDNNLIPLRAIFHAAIEEGLLNRSPPATIRNLKVQHDLPDRFSRHEMKTILGHLGDRHSVQARNWYEFAFTTGVRPGEQLALRWEDVDWDGGAIRMQRARVREEVKRTKNYHVRDEILPLTVIHSGRGYTRFRRPASSAASARVLIASLR